MLTDNIVALLIAERDRLNRAIEALQGPAKRRGRPPKNPIAVIADTTQPKKKHHVSAAARRKMAAAQKKRWAAERAGK